MENQRSIHLIAAVWLPLLPFLEAAATCRLMPSWKAELSTNQIKMENVVMEKS